MELSEEGKILVTGSKRGIVRIYIGSSGGTEIYLNQILFEPEEEILSIRITNDNLMFLATTMNQNTYIYVRGGEDLNFHYDHEKSNTFIRDPKKYVSIELPEDFTNYTKKRYETEERKERERKEKLEAIKI